MSTIVETIPHHKLPNCSTVYRQSTARLYTHLVLYRITVLDWIATKLAVFQHSHAVKKVCVTMQHTLV